MNQRNEPEKRDGFTLIELLIVVAIIAILAAIAIPNLLEAMMRAKVARALTDMRTVTIAIEAYQVDNGSYIHSVCPDDSWPNAETTWHWYSFLTTPKAFMLNLPLDPFSRLETNSWGGGLNKNPFHFYSGNAMKYSNSEDYINAQRVFYMLLSLGPNLEIDVDKVDYTHADAFVLYDITEFNKGGSSWDGVPYDASNGTKSVGDLHRFSGEVLPLFKD